MAAKKAAAPALSGGTNLTIGFGLVNVNVGMKPATGDGDKVQAVGAVSGDEVLASYLFPGLTINVWRGRDGAPVVQIDTESEELAGDVRVYLNDATAAWR